MSTTRPRRKYDTYAGVHFHSLSTGQALSGARIYYASKAEAAGGRAGWRFVALDASGNAAGPATGPFNSSRAAFQAYRADRRSRVAQAPRPLALNLEF